MDIRKTLGELDLLFEKKCYDKIESFLLSKIQEAEEEHDSSSILTLLNELIGFFRSSSRYEEAIALGDHIISLVKEMGLEETVSYATSILNVATVYREAGKIDESMAYYLEVLNRYKNTLPEYDMRFAGLYNNMSQACIEIKDYEKACDLLRKALSIVVLNNGVEIEEAITSSNLAMVLMKRNQLTEALTYIEKSLSIFEKEEGPKDFHYSAALSGMGEAQVMLKNYEKALDYFHRALDEIEKNIGQNIHYAMTCANISLVYDKINDKEQKDKYKSMAEAVYNKFKQGEKNEGP